MKINALKVGTAIVSLLIGYAIVHSLSPGQEEMPEKKPVPNAFEFNNGAEIALDCVFGSEPYRVHFSAYQRPENKLPGVDYQQAFCDQLPSLGPTLITLDFMDKALRERVVALKFVHHQQANPSADALAAAQLVKDSVHNGIPRGLIQSQLELSKVGFYTLVIEIGGGVVSTDETITIPFEVGATL